MPGDRAPRLLVDVRESRILRGFHIVAALHLAADGLREVAIFRVGGKESSEAIACTDFEFETGLRLQPLDDDKDHFDLYALAASEPPTDSASISARARARKGLLALVFQPRAVGGYAVIDGNDTSAIAGQIVRSLRAIA